ncbi:MAG: hypothetical protein LWW93_09455 [Hyphomicrobiales bacterium]|nr:hypothetical protein [Hyphomicrobiales bacterium]
MTLAKLSLAALFAAVALTPALADDDGSPVGAYLASLAAPAQPAAVKVVEGRQARHVATPAPAPTPAMPPLTDAERYLLSR